MTLRARMRFASDDNTFGGAVALAGMMAVFPLIQALPTDMDRTAALAFCPTVWLLLRHSLPPSGKAERMDLGLLTVTGALAIVAAVFSRQFAANFVLTCTWIWTIAIGVSSRRLAHSAPAVRLVLTGVAMGGLAGLLWTRMLPIDEGVAFPLYGHARIFGLHMLLSAAAVLTLLVSAPTTHTIKCFTFVAGVVLWSGLFWSGSRAPLAGLAAATIIWFWFGTVGEKRRLAIWVPVLGLAGILGSQLLGTQTRSLGWMRIVASTVHTNGIQGFSSERNLIWSQTLGEISHSPWIGQGADAYRFIQPLPVGDQPHNFILQWVLAFGIPAALALIILLGRRTLRGLRGTSELQEHTVWQRGAAACLVAAIVGGLFDGVFYHAVAFIPVAFLAGLAGATASEAKTSRVAHGGLWRRTGQMTCIIASAIVGLHAWLFFNLLAPPPSSSRAIAAQVLHAFPSATYGFWRWIDAWATSVPVQERLAWLKWAQNHAPQPAIFYYQEAQCNLVKRDLVAAKNALDRAVITSSGNDRKHYAELLGLTEEAIARRNGK